jgi:hypothetical protein
MASSCDRVRLQLRDGWWLIDWDAIAKIELAMYRATYRNTYSKLTPLARDGGIVSRWMPEVSTLEVDFDRVNAKAEAEAMLAVVEWKNRRAAHRLGGEELRHELAADQAATESEATGFRRKLQAITKKNMENVRAADEFWGAWKRGAEVTRDISAEILVIGGTAIAAPLIAAGGIGAAAGASGWLAGGSALKGVAKFQDTNSVGAAMIEATSTFGFAVLTPAAELKGAKNVAVIFLAKMPVNALEGYVEARNEGKPLTKALQAAAAQAVAEAATSVILGSPKVEQVMRKLTIPVSVSLHVRREVGMELRKGTAGSLGGFGAKKIVEKAGELVAGAKRAESHEDASRPFDNLVATGSPVFRAVLDHAVRRAI